MAYHQNHPNGDSPCDDREYREKKFEDSLEVREFYEKKLEEIRICLTPIIYFLNSTQIPPSVRLAKKMLIQFCDYPNWEKIILSFDEDSFMMSRQEDVSI